MQAVTAHGGIQAAKPTARSWLKQATTAIADLLFPPRCVGCGAWGDWLCNSCLAHVETIEPPVCDRCGMPLQFAIPTRPDSLSGTLCEHCREAPYALDGLRFCAFHAGPLRQAIHQLKYEDLRALARPLGRLMGQAWSRLAPANQPVDAVVPIPLHRKRERERGYNQAALLAREFGLYLGVPVVENVLVRTRHTAPQVGLNIQQRRANVADAFQCATTCLTGRVVLLLDDVCTTGATLEAAASTLRQRGAGSVWGITLARAKPHLSVDSLSPQT